MKPSNVFQLEMASVSYSRRALTLKVLFTIFLGFPFVVIAMPMKVRISGLMMLLIFSSFFGAAVTIVRRRTDGHLSRLRLLPIPLWKIMGDFILSGALVDMLQMGSVLTLFLIVNGQNIHIGNCMITAGMFCITVVLLNILGLFLGLAFKSNSEVHLVGALLTGIIALFSGILPVPSRLEWLIGTISRMNPLTLLHHSLTVSGENTVTASNNCIFFPVLFMILFITAVIWRAADWKSNSEKGKI